MSEFYILGWVVSAMENSTEVLLPLSQRAVEVLEPRETEDIVRLLMSTKGNNGKSLSAGFRGFSR